MYKLIGKTLLHSYSKEIHEAFGKYTYDLENLPTEEDFVSFVRGRLYDGLNVTIPYKQAIIPYLNELDENARLIGSVNTVVRKGETLIGYNTDYAGFKSAADAAGISFSAQKVVILGTGGTSLTAQAVVRDANAKEIIVVSRSGENNYENISKHADADILVNTTPVGMYPDTGKTPLHLSTFHQLKGVVDVIYNPLRTALALEARDAGIPVAEGLRMLVAQAAKACAYFSGEAPSAALEEKVLLDLYHRKSNIVLVGMPGCGKTTAAQKLAKLSAREMIDTDTEIVKRVGKPIPEIFAEKGESFFRDLESAVIADVGRQTGKIIATGGGAVLREENYPHLAQNGRIYFLTRPTSELSTAGRPLSQSSDLREMYRVRLPRYLRFADCEIPPAENAAIRAEHIWEEFCHAYPCLKRT